MNIRDVRSVFGFSLLFLSLNGFASSGITLNDLREEVLSNNLDLQIQYENYYQSQKNVSVALGQFLPSANINYIYVNSTLAILQSVVPTPSGWFKYQASQELEVAEKFTTESIRLNILEGLTINYINLKYHEQLMASLVAQEKILEEVYAEVIKKEELGLVNASEVFVARRNLFQHRQDIYQLESLMIAEKQAMQIALNRQPNDLPVLGDLPVDDMDGIPAEVSDGAALALRNSTELMSNSYQAEAAKYMVKSSKWSFISFSGIGFDYAANLSIERSKARIIGLQGDKIAIKIKNQVYSTYELIDILDRRIELQKAVVESVRIVDERNSELYLNNVITFNDYYSSKQSLIDESEVLVRLEMERRIKIASLRRLLGLDSTLSAYEINEDDIQLATELQPARLGKTHVWVSVKAGKTEDLKNVFSVTYSVDGLFSNRKFYGAAGDLRLYFKVKGPGEYTVNAQILMLTGEMIHKELKVVVQ